MDLENNSSYADQYAGCYWGIFFKDTTAQLHYVPLATFPTQKMCWEYLDLLKEKVTFEMASVESAEEEWGRDKFFLDRVVTLSRKATTQKYRDLSSWPVD